MTHVVEIATAGDLPAIRALLDAANLPSSDLAEGATPRFWVVRDDELLGTVGLESFGATGLLRSLVVAPRGRRTGLGDRLVREVETGAADAGIRQLVLLTQTAEHFFSNRGYVVIDRANAPAEVRNASEFKSLCPASATCMSKTLR